MARIERFEELKCWQKARSLPRDIYQLSGQEPLAKEYRLRNQLTAASVSVMSNIAEGFSHYHRREFIRFLDIAQSSASEVKCLLYVVLDQEYASREKIEALHAQYDECRNLPLGLLRCVNRQGKQQEVGEVEHTYAMQAFSPLQMDRPGEFVVQKNTNT